MQFLKYNCKKCYKLLFFGLREAILKIFQKSPKRENEFLQNIICLVSIQVHTFLQVFDINFDNLLLDASHYLDCHVVEHIYIVLRHWVINLFGVK